MHGFNFQYVNFDLCYLNLLKRKLKIIEKQHNIAKIEAVGNHSIQKPQVFGSFKLDL